MSSASGPKSPGEIKKLKKDDLLSYALEITKNFNELRLKCENFEARIASLESSSKSPTTLSPNLTERMEKIERDITNNSQYLRRRQLELWNMPTEIADSRDQKKEVANILSLTGINVSPGDIDICHKLKKQGQLIIEMRNRDLRDRVLRARKNLKNKKSELLKKKCTRMSVVESMCPEYRRLDYICRKLKTKELIDNTWFFGRKLFIIDSNNSKIIVSHITDLETKFGKQVIDDILDKDK